MALAYTEAGSVTTPPLPLPDPLVTARAKLDAYEARHGILGPRRREELLASYLAANQEPPPTIHPLGRGADPSHDHRTAANRTALARSLTQYFAGNLDRDTITKPVEKSESRTGADLADRFVSRLELARELAWLEWHHRHLHRAVVFRFRDDLTLRRLGEMWHVAPQRVKEEIEEGLDLLVARIWVD